MLNTKEDILKNMGNQTIDEPPLISIVGKKNIIEENGAHQLFDYQHSLKHLLLFSTE